MEAPTFGNARSTMPSTLDRSASTRSERLIPWLLGVALLAICLVSASVALAR